MKLFENISKLYVYTSYALDLPTSEFLPDASEFLEELGKSTSEIAKILDEVDALFRRHGYKGVGDRTKVMFIPPIAPAFRETEHEGQFLSGCYVFYGQSDGTAYYASPVPFPNRILDRKWGQ